MYILSSIQNEIWS